MNNFVFFDREKYDQAVQGRYMKESDYMTWPSHLCSKRDHSPIGSKPNVILEYRGRKYKVLAQHSCNTFLLLRL